jgi:hypothetical protein
MSRKRRSGTIEHRGGNKYRFAYMKDGERYKKSLEV